MGLLSIIYDAPNPPEHIRRSLSDRFKVQFVRLRDLDGVKPDHVFIVDVDFASPASLITLKQWIEGKTKDAVIFVVIDGTSHLQRMQAQAMGANDTLRRPIDEAAIVSKLTADFERLSLCPPEFEQSKGAMAALDALRHLFSSVYLGLPVNVALVNDATKLIVRHMETMGVGAWIEIIRTQQSHTYRHSLLVAGVAASFGHHLGFSVADLQRVAFAGMLHDIGKAKIPLQILEKPAPLDDDELSLMRRHPELGNDILRSLSRIDPNMIDIVLHHHEYLDGSGYPHGLRARQISDLVRLITISDSFSALIERRSYKHALPSAAAYKVLTDMGPKLDADLVREFSYMSRLEFENA